MKFKIDAYRIFFLVGIVFSVLGASFWFFYNIFNWDLSKTSQFHSEWMMGGFLNSFVIGFIFSALPRMTFTHGPNPIEVFLCLLFLIFSFIFSFYIFQALVGIVLVIYIGRVLQSRNFLGSSLFLLLGAVFLVIGSLGMHFDGSLIFKTLFFETVILCIVIGAGSRMVPVLLGYVVDQQKSVKYFWPILCLFFALSFGNHFGFMFLRWVMVVYVFFRYWGVCRKPQKRNYLVYFVFLSCWFILIGLGLKTFNLIPEKSALHVFYIGGLGLLTFCVSARIVIAHGNFSLQLENSRYILLFSIGVLSALVLRLISVPWYWASALWVISSVLWGVFLVPKILKVNPRSF